MKRVHAGSDLIRHRRRPTLPLLADGPLLHRTGLDLTGQQSPDLGEAVGVGDVLKGWPHHLAAALDDSNNRVRAKAAQALGWIGEPATEAVPVLVRALRDDDNLTHCVKSQRERERRSLPFSRCGNS